MRKETFVRIFNLINDQHGCIYFVYYKNESGLLFRNDPNGYTYCHSCNISYDTRRIIVCYPEGFTSEYNLCDECTDDYQDLIYKDCRKLIRW